MVTNAISLQNLPAGQSASILRILGRPDDVADASIFPSFGGRFSFTPGECRSVAEGCRMRMGTIKPCLPAPGGGIRFETVTEIVAFYGPDTLFLIGGGLFKHGPELIENCHYFRKMIDTIQ